MKLDLYHNRIVADTMTPEFEDGITGRLLPLLEKKYDEIQLVQMYEDYIADKLCDGEYFYYPLTVLTDLPITQWIRWKNIPSDFEDGLPYAYVGRGPLEFELCDRVPVEFEEKLIGRNRYFDGNAVKLQVETLGENCAMLSGKYSQTFIDEMARQLTKQIETATGTEELAKSSVELSMVFASGTYMAHNCDNVTYRRLMLKDKVSAPRDFWVKWTRLDGALAYSVSAHVNSKNILFELGEDVEHKIREKEYRYLLSSAGEKYHNSMGRKKVTEWREVIKRAAKRGDLVKIESDYELAPETLEMEERLADILGKRTAPVAEPKPEIPYIHADQNAFDRAIAKARMFVNGGNLDVDVAFSEINEEEKQSFGFDGETVGFEAADNQEFVGLESLSFGEEMLDLPEENTTAQQFDDAAELPLSFEPISDNGEDEDVPPFDIDDDANDQVEPTAENAGESVARIEEKTDVDDNESVTNDENSISEENSEENEENEENEEITVEVFVEDEENDSFSEEEIEENPIDEERLSQIVEMMHKPREVSHNVEFEEGDSTPSVSEDENNFFKDESEPQIASQNDEKVDDPCEICEEKATDAEKAEEEKPFVESATPETQENPEAEIAEKTEISEGEKSDFAEKKNGESVSAVQQEKEVIAEEKAEIKSASEKDSELEEKNSARQPQSATLADRVADIRAEIETKIRLEFESRARVKAEEELVALRREKEKLRLEKEAILVEAEREQQRLRAEYARLLEQTERAEAEREVEEERRRREDEKRRAEEEQLRAEIEKQLRAEARERERLAESARMAIEDRNRIAAENARIEREREEQERIKAEQLRREQEERELEALRQAEIERIRREDEETKARARAAMPEMGDGKYSYTSKIVKLIFRRSVDPNITARIYEIIKATVDYYGKDRVYLKIKAYIPDTQTVVLEFEHVPIEEMTLLGNIIKILGNSGLGIAKAIVE